MRIQRISLLALIPCLMFAAAAPAAQDNLADLDLATLMSMDVTVTSAAKHAQATSDAAAAVFVITREDIRRTGASSLPEVLRIVPGIQVARINKRSWAVTARGFNSRFANKLLVMVDGRSIYTPLFSGVMWEEQPVFLDNIERIEVVRGPGGALWGINAVNGIINIITRKASDTAGLHVSGAGGTMESEAAGLRYGGSVAGIGDYRFYADHTKMDSFEDGGTPWRRTQAGWRLDSAAAGGSLTFEGDLHEADFGDLDGYEDSYLPRTIKSGNALTNWQRDTTRGNVDLRAYYSWIDRGAPGEWNESTLGLDAQFVAHRIGRHLLTAGTGLRHTVETQENPLSAFGFATLQSSHDQLNIYAQDEAHFLDDRARLIVGAKLEDFEFTGLALQPTVRGLWKATDSHTFWAAASRAVRTPSRVELFSRFSLQITGEPFTYFVLSGDEHLDAEEMNSYELGWRWRPDPQLSVDLALYRNDYQHMIAITAQPTTFTPGFPPRIEVHSTYSNTIDASVYGAELMVEWMARDWLRLQAQGVWHEADEASVGITTQAGVVDPKQSFALHAHVDLPRAIELDLAWRAVSKLEPFKIPSYDSLSARIAWRPVKSIELSFAIDNVFDNEHQEFLDEIQGRLGATIGRSFFGRIVWQPAP